MKDDTAPQNSHVIDEPLAINILNDQNTMLRDLRDVTGAKLSIKSYILNPVRHEGTNIIHLQGDESYLSTGYFPGPMKGAKRKISRRLRNRLNGYRTGMFEGTNYLNRVYDFRTSNHIHAKHGTLATMVLANADDLITAGGITKSVIDDSEIIDRLGRLRQRRRKLLSNYAGITQPVYIYPVVQGMRLRLSQLLEYAANTRLQSSDSQELKESA